MSEHTPGPWKTDHNSIVQEGTGFSVADVWTPRGHNHCANQPTPQRREQKANASLIAAAPDLLDALEAVESWIDNEIGKRINPGTNDDDQVVCRAVRSAILKAKGD